MILTAERGQQIGDTIRSILENLASITEEELEDLQTEAQRDSAFGPFLDPTAYQGGQRFDLNRKMKLMAEALLELKRRVGNLGPGSPTHS